jgi:Fe-S oxidoreductase
LATPQAEVEWGYTPKQAAAEAGRCLRCTCSECVKNCTFLQAYVRDFPATEKGLARLLAPEAGADSKVAYSCHYCGLCQAVCPKDLHAGELCLNERQRLVASGLGPLPQHRGIRSYVRWGTSPAFTLSRPDPVTGRAVRVFFPGCSLPGYHPHLVVSSYQYLRERLPGTGLMLNCCGAPVMLTGETAWFQGILTNLAQELTRLGAREVVCACTHCLEVLKNHLPEFPAQSLYEVLREEGLPPTSRAERGVFHLHDACGARQMPEVHQAVRELLGRLGHHLEELAHHGPTSICCGAGGMVPAVDPGLARRMTEFRLSEASHNLATYCASCRAVFAGAGRPSLHLLELIFNPDWRPALNSPPAGSLARWWRRWRLKRRLA